MLSSGGGQTMKQQKILIIDGIPQWPLGVEFCQALQGQWKETYYLSQKFFDRKYFYGIRRGIAKLIDKKPKAYVHPLLPEAQFKQKLDEIRPTIVLVIGFIHHLVGQDYLKMLKRQYGFQLILWDTDSANYGQSAQLFKEFFYDEIMRYDKVFSFSSAMVRYLNRLNFMPAEYLHFGAIACPHMPKLNAAKTIDVCFAGIPNLRRIFLLSSIEDESLCIIGERWKRIENILSEKMKSSCSYKNSLGEELYTTMTRSKIIVNITNSDFYGIHSGLALRFFEAVALKCFLLTDRLEETQELFVPGKEVETFSTPEEFSDKIKFYSKNDEARNNISIAGYEKFSANYTWNHQARRFLDLLGLS